jgi:hypothetical protein
MHDDCFDTVIENFYFHSVYDTTAFFQLLIILIARVNSPVCISSQLLCRPESQVFPLLGNVAQMHGGLRSLGDLHTGGQLEVDAMKGKKDGARRFISCTV